MPPNEQSKSRIYINEYGSIKLTQLNDTLWKTEFENIEGYQFDTTMVSVTDDSAFWRYLAPEEELFLQYSWGGLSVGKNSLLVLEFSSYGRLAHQSGIKELYYRAFYRADQTVEIKGDLKRSKSGISVDEIYILEQNQLEAGYHLLEGKVVREKYPMAYYSTDESPQGMFSDTTIIHYRLVLKNMKEKALEIREFVGYPVNISSGEAAIAWEFADSDAYILEGHAPWTTDELNQKIVVRGTYVYNGKGSFIKNWEIIDGH